MTFHRRTASCIERLEFQADGRVIPFGGMVDFAGAARKSIRVFNRGDTDVSEDSVVSLVEDSTFVLSPAVIGPIPAGAERIFDISVNEASLASRDAVVRIVNGGNPTRGEPAWTHEFQVRDHGGSHRSFPRINSPPVAVDDEVMVNANSGFTVIQALANDYDPDGETIRITSLTAAQLGEARANSGGRSISYKPDSGIYGEDSFTYTASDGRNGATSAIVTVKITDTIVEITTSPTAEQSIAVNQNVHVQVDAATSAGTIARIQLFTNRVVLAETNRSPLVVDWKPGGAGFYTLTAVALDDAGASSEASALTFGVSTVGDHSPIALITNLADQQIVREGIFTVRGTADDPDATPAAPVSYEVLLYRPDDGTTSTENRKIAAFTPPSTSSVVDDVLAVMDLTTLRNGVYEVELKVNQGGRSSMHLIRFVLESQAKVGQFIFSERDLVLPVNGLPLAVIRTYDSFNASSGDFGPGWRLAIQDMEVYLDEQRRLQPTDPDDPLGEQFSMRVGGGRNVTLTLPGGRRTTFVFSLQPGQSDTPGQPCFCYWAKWRPAPGVLRLFGIAGR